MEIKPWQTQINRMYPKCPPSDSHRPQSRKQCELEKKVDYSRFEAQTCKLRASWSLLIPTLTSELIFFSFLCVDVCSLSPVVVVVV